MLPPLGDSAVLETIISSAARTVEIQEPFHLLYDTGKAVWIASKPSIFFSILSRTRTLEGAVRESGGISPKEQLKGQSFKEFLQETIDELPVNHDCNIMYNKSICGERAAKETKTMHNRISGKAAFLFLLITILVLSVTACNKGISSDTTTGQVMSEATTTRPPATPTTAPTSSPAPTLTSCPSLTPEPTPVLELRSRTTGLIIDEQVPFMPVGVMIENSTAARPQTGLQVADIVYEAPVEGCTRFFCIYNDDMPQNVGPVRSTRLYFVRMQQEWDSAFVHAGGPQSGLSNVYTDAAAHIDTRIDITKGTYARYYWRIDERAAPHNAYVSPAKCQQLMQSESQSRTFTFAEDVEYAGKTVSTVVLPFYIGEVIYRYDAASDQLLRYSGSKPFIDADTQKAISVQNLIVQYNYFYHGNETLGRWLCDLLGQGTADFFIGGKHITGSWERSSYDKPTIYRDQNGIEIVLLPGNTWIALHPDNRKISISYAE